MTFPAELQARFIKVLSKGKIAYASGWANYMENVSNPAALVVEIKTEEQLQTVIKAIKELNAERTPDDKITVRATAGWSDSKTCGCSLFPWNDAQENQYNEGFSFSQVVGGRTAPGTPGTDVVIRFAKKFHHKKIIGAIDEPVVFNPENPIHQLPSTLVEVSAGVQISEFADYLRKHNLSLPTVSMIAWVTAVGLAGTAGHGTGRDEPAFSGLIESIRVCDMDGEIREINADHPDFEALRGGHSGLLGVVLSIKLRAVKAFNLRETIELYPNTEAMTGKLDDVLKDNQYVSIMGVPSYGCPEIAKLVPKWQVRKWNYSTEKPTKKANAPYDADIRSFAQELQVRVGASVMEFLLDSGLKHLMPAFMLLSAAVVTGTRGTKAKVDFENHITHPQVAFPKDMRDVSYLIPVKDSEAGTQLETILEKMESLLNSGAARGEYPVTYAVYVRYIKGTNGGLSTSFTTAEDEHILAIDVVTHPEAPGIARFEHDFMTYLKENEITPRNHLGKNFPAGVVSYDQFLGAERVNGFKSVLERWYNSNPEAHDGAERLAMSPFNTPYMQQMLTPRPALKAELADEPELNSVEVPHNDHTDMECAEFLNKLHAEVAQLEVNTEEGVAAKNAFLKACMAEMSLRSERVHASM
ncbi:FAD-binding protein [Legionella shakespearei]|uniref:L-gulono-gamma-lactone oxidase n=1 Tax=Legionella shakespearei DSM 23087 TaxID=1122169 RepID=A0A0W0YL35_9GAMM|nr:FAD-binding protein [Legionella shakespearei]KTD57270.1 L-gulono-gamma-lactone oxidase [Legionella shakespearei DSM 23087]